mgnify:CR=1 FL=1
MKQDLPTTNIKGKEYVLVNDRIKRLERTSLNTALQVR